MPSPFPGMNPYLERTGLWRGVHNHLIVSIADDLGPRVQPRYYVSKDQEPTVEIGRLLHELYDRMGYSLRLDYTKEPEPPLKPEDTAWADELLRQKGLR
jgi:hypothetical protein